MKRIFEKLKFKKNLDILLIISLTAISLVLLTAPKFLNSEQSTNNNEQLTKVATDSASRSAQIQADSNSENEEPEQSLNQSNGLRTNHQEDQSNPVKGATKKAPGSKTTTTTEPKAQNVVLKVETGTNSYSYKVSWQENMSVYDVLSKASTENGFSLVSKPYGPPLNSYYVTGIAGKICECWTYLLNGGEVDHEGKPLKGASLVKVNNNDIITWKAT